MVIDISDDHDDNICVTPVFDNARRDLDRGKRVAQELEDAVAELETLLLRFGLLEEI